MKEVNSGRRTADSENLPDAGLSAVRCPPSTQSLSRLRWRCRRGMRELDVVLQRYLELRYLEAPVEERQAFESLLEEQDPVLLAYLTGREHPQDSRQANVIARLAHPGY
jgi:antitoxin CptB